MRIIYHGNFDAIEDAQLGVTLEHGDEIDVSEEQARPRLAQRENFGAVDADAEKIVEELEAIDEIRDELAAEPFDVDAMASALDDHTKAHLLAFIEAQGIAVEGDPVKPVVIEHLVAWTAMRRGIDLQAELAEPGDNDEQTEG
ncbi:hypothetical protein GCM10008944_01620 [Cytobacillus oceanisediminis]